MKTALTSEIVVASPIDDATASRRILHRAGLVAGVSLLSSCRMKFRPHVRPGSVRSGRRLATHELTLERRSAYLMTAESRNDYEHHIPAVKHLRYSITFRTLRS